MLKKLVAKTTGKFFSTKRSDSLIYKESKTFLIEGAAFVVPSHWIEERFILKNEKELIIAFSKEDEPITVFLSKEVTVKTIFKDSEVELSVNEAIVHKLHFHLLFSSIPSDRIFKYNFKKDLFVSCQFYR